MNCKYCDKEFKPVNKQQKYCTQSCRYKNQMKVKKERTTKRQKNKKLICGVCKKEFTPEAVNQLYCCDECKHIAKLNQQRKNTAKRKAMDKMSIILGDGSIDPYYLTRNGGKPITKLI